MFWRIVLAAGFLLGLQTACEDKVVEQSPPAAKSGPGEQALPPPAAGSSGQAQTPAAGGASLQVDSGDTTWTPSRGERQVEEGRDPFYGFVDELIAERKRAEREAAAAAELEEEPLKPAQRFDVPDFKLVAVVTNTAQPKALLIDPHGNPHKLKTGDLIGKKNGVIVDIRRNEIEILQGDNLLEGERVVMKLHPDVSETVLIELK